MRRTRLANREPSSDVDRCGKQHHRGEEDGRRPIVEDGLNRILHWIRLSKSYGAADAGGWAGGVEGGCSLLRTIFREASMAGVKLPPRSVSRKRTSAVVSAGFRAFP